jgi:ribose transport system permease protein
MSAGADERIADAVEPKVGLRPRDRVRSLALGRTTSVLGVVLVLGAALAIATPSGFLTVSNLLDVGRQSSLLGLMTVGVTLVLICGQIDLSIAATYTLSGLVCAMLIGHGYNVGLAVLCALLVGAGAGFVNAILTATLKIPSFIVTLGTLQIMNGTSLLITGAEDQAIFGVHASGLDAFTYAGQGSPAGIPMQLIILLAVAAIVAVVLRRSVFGMRLYATGGNPRAADLAGIPVRRVQTWAFVSSGVLASVAGMLALGFISSVSPIGGQGLEFEVFAAAVIGGASLFGGYGTAIGAVLGAFLISLLKNGLVLLAVSPFWQIVTIGIVTIAAVGLNRFLQQREIE